MQTVEKETWAKKITKTLAILYPAKHLLDNDSIISILFSHTHLYLNHSNISWGSTHFTKLKAIHYQQKPDAQ